MSVYLVLAVAVVVGVVRARDRIRRVEGPGGHRPDVPSRGERWRRADGAEKAAFIVMAASALLWLLLLLPIGFAAAVTALALAVWKRPYLERTLAPVAVGGGIAITLLSVLPRLLRPGDGDQGAVVVNAIMFGGLWIVIGLLLWAAGSRAEERV